MFKLSSRVLLILMFALMADACARYQYEPEPVETLHSIEAYHKRSLESPALGEFIGQYDTGSTLWPISRWDLASLTLAAWYFNPQLQIAIAGHQKSIAEQETAGQLINPRLGLPFEYHSDTTGGVSPWLIGLVFDLVLERPAKRQAKLDRARAGVDLAKTNIYSVAWDIYSNLRKHYIALYQAREIRKNLSEQAAITEEMLSLLQKRRQAGQASDFEVAVIRIELQRLKIALSQQQLAEIDSLVHLAGVVGVSSTELENISISFRDIERLSGHEALEIHQLLNAALSHRLDIRMALEEYAFYEAGLRLEIEKQYPDIVLSPGFIFDQNDNIWALGASWVLPLFHPENEPAIRRSLAERKLKQFEFLSLQNRVVNEVELTIAQYKAKKTAIDQAGKLYEEALERKDILQKQFDVGYADRLQLSRSKLETEIIRQSVVELQLSLIEQAGRIEDAMQYPLGEPAYQPYIYNE